MPVEDVDGPGRHAGPVEQADAILWAADVRERSSMLLDSLRMMGQAGTDVPAPVLQMWSTQWIRAAYDLIMVVLADQEPSRG